MKFDPRPTRKAEGFVTGMVPRFQSYMLLLVAVACSGEPGYPTPPASSCTEETSVAILISGQIGRFLYQNQIGPLVGADGGDKPCLDVFVALHNGTLARPWTDSVSAPPYLARTSVSSIEGWFASRGAREVVVKMVDDNHMQSVETVVYSRITSELGVSGASLIRSVCEKNWLANFRMQYLRHLVMSLTSSRAYSTYTYWRDDNYFLEPLAMSALRAGLNKSPPVVIVDQWCGFDGYSDKIYVSNRLGAHLLWDASFGDFSAKMAAWVRFSLSRRDELNPCSTEAFIHHILEPPALVVKIDLHRTEIRYEGGAVCVPALYWRCTPALTTAGRTNQTALAICSEKPGDFDRLSPKVRARWERDHRDGVPLDEMS